MAVMIVYIQHKDTEQVLDVKESNDEPGAVVVLYTYYATPNQHWRFSDGKIVSELSGLVLDVDPATGKLVTAEDSGASSQHWTLDDSGALKNGDGRFVTAVAAETEEGIWDVVASPENTSSPSQGFAFVGVDSS